MGTSYRTAGALMKISRVRAYVLRCSLGSQTFYSSQAPFPERTSCLVRVETDDGLVGWGEGGQWGPPEPVAAMIDKVLEPQLIGEDPLRIAVIWEKLYAYVRDWGRQATGMEALSAVDLALWDLAGKRLGQPVHALLGGAHRERVVAYATGCYYRSGHERWEDTASLADEACSYLEAGFRALKMKIGLLPLAKDLARVRAVREALGPDVPLMVDANHAYAAHTAIAAGRGLEAAGVYWFEEPVVPEDRIGYRQVAGALDLAVAGGECEYTRYGFRDLITERCVDIAQPDLACAGGLTEGRNIAALASAFGVQVVPHVWGSGIALAAALHFAASLPPSPATANPLTPANEPMLEFDRNPNPLRDDLLAERISLHADGSVPVPHGPGLGVTVVEDALRAYAG
jgi:D-galactarolactone cycloisomerase